MPTKTINNKLFYSVDGKEFKEFSGIDDIGNPELKTTTLADRQSMYDLFYKPHTVTFMFNRSYILASRFCHVLCGKSNNWLRLHGYPMVRRKDNVSRISGHT
ncbi:MAG: hypothetical protein WC998_05200 [Candidatus Paceibacterota bacterium]|jgi:hypothetical protein